MYTFFCRQQILTLRELFDFKREYHKNLEVIPSNDLAIFKLVSFRPQKLSTFNREYFIVIEIPNDHVVMSTVRMLNFENN